MSKQGSYDDVSWLTLVDSANASRLKRLCGGNAGPPQWIRNPGLRRCFAHNVGIGQNRQAAAMHAQSSMVPVEDHEPRRPKRQVSKALVVSSKRRRIHRMSRRGRL